MIYLAYFVAKNAISYIIVNNIIGIVREVFISWITQTGFVVLLRINKLLRQ